jgi:hypothetical protein
VGVGREDGSDLGAVSEAFDECLVERPFEGPAGRLWGDVEEGAGGGGDRDLLVAPGVAGVEVGCPVDADAVASPAGLLADHGNVDVSVEEWADAPDGSGGVVAEKGAVATRKDRGKLGSERRECGERHH